MGYYNNHDIDSIISFFFFNWAGKMVKVLSTKTDNLSSSPETHTVERELPPPGCLPAPSPAPSQVLSVLRVCETQTRAGDLAYSTCTWVFSVHGKILDSVLGRLSVTAPSEHLPCLSVTSSADAGTVWVFPLTGLAPPAYRWSRPHFCWRLTVGLCCCSPCCLGRLPGDSRRPEPLLSSARNCTDKCCEA